MDWQTSKTKKSTTQILKRSMLYSWRGESFRRAVTDSMHVCTRYKVELEEGFDNIIVLDGVPVIDGSKVEKLLAKVCKEFSKRGAHIKPADIHLPWDEKTSKSKGCA